MYENNNEKVELNEIEEEIQDFIENEVEESPLLFNPKDIEIEVKQQSLDVLISRIREGAIDMNTPFQRNGNLWGEPVQIRLIESILMGMPLPAFYFDSSNKNKWLIVDGLQRLHTLKNFVLNTESNFLDKEKILDPKAAPLVLKNLHFLREYNGLTYDKLNVNDKRTFKETSVTVYLIKPGTPEQVKYELFSRINTGGLMLNSQEIRHALNEGKNSTIILNEVVENAVFKRIVNISHKRMQTQELTLRYFAFSLNAYKYYGASFASFLNETMAKMNQMPIERLKELAAGLIKALVLCEQIFGKYAFSQSIISNKEKTRITFNRALFECLTVNIAPLSDENQKILLSKKEAFVKAIKKILDDETLEQDSFLKQDEILINQAWGVSFKKSISVSTSHNAAVIRRFRTIKLILDEIIKENHD